MKKQYPTFKIIEVQQIKDKPDIKGALFSYIANNVKFGGFGIAISQGKQGFWADIYGKEDSFTTYNPVMVLSYVLQSLNQGEKPLEPKIEIPKEVAEKSKEAAPKEGSDEYYKKKTAESMMGTHMWNMTPYMFPKAFSSKIGLW